MATSRAIFPRNDWLKRINSVFHLNYPTIILQLRHLEASVPRASSLDNNIEQHNKFSQMFLQQILILI